MPRKLKEIASKKVKTTASLSSKEINEIKFDGSLNGNSSETDQKSCNKINDGVRIKGGTDER
jgi:hypothetical protein